MSTAIFFAMFANVTSLATRWLTSNSPRDV